MGLAHLVCLLVGCGGEPKVAPESSEVLVASPTPEAEGPQRWSAANIKLLKPARPEIASQTQLPLRPDQGIQRAMDTLTSVVDTYARDPGDPWALGHGLLAHGASMQLADGRSAVDHLFSEYARVFDANGHEFIYFPKSVDGTLIQPHSELLLKAITESELAPDTPIQVEGRQFTAADLYRGTLLRTYLDAPTNHSSFASTNDMPWALQAIAAWAPASLDWTASDGTQMSLNTLTDFNAVVLRKETRFLAQAFAKKASFKKQRQGIYQYTCGGAHLIQGVSFAVARGYGHARGHALIAEQGMLALFRMQVELEQIDAAVKAQPAVAFQLHVQRLKLTGHTLETLHKMSAAGQFSKDSKAQKALEWVAAEVVRSVALLDGHKAFEKLQTIKDKDLQLFRDIVGDACHALRGLKLATGQAQVRLYTSPPTTP